MIFQLGTISDELMLYMQSFGLPLNDFLLFVLLMLVFYCAIFIILKIIMYSFNYISRKTKTSLDDQLLKIAKKYSWWLALLLSLFFAVEEVYPSAKVGAYDALQLFVIAFMIFLAFLLAEALDVFLVWYGVSIQPKDRKSIPPKQVFPFVRAVLKTAVYLVFLIFVLQYAGFDTAALLTGLGVAGLAVALALQDTLANFFAGLHLLIDKPFREGDYVSLEGGAEGYIDRIGWRTTRIVTGLNNEIIVPNSKLAGAIIQNFASPDSNAVVFYEVGVSYDSDVEEVERIIMTAINNVAKKNAYMVPDSGFVRLDKFGDYALVFLFGYKVNGYINRFAVLKDVNKELLKQFRKNRIEIPFPIRVMMQK